MPYIVRYMAFRVDGSFITHLRPVGAPESTRTVVHSHHFTNPDDIHTGDQVRFDPVTRTYSKIH